MAIGIDTAIDRVKNLTASWRENERIKKENEFSIIRIHKSMIPKGAKLVECYETDTEIIVVGFPKEDDESHNCDQMGCSSLSHVMYRLNK